MQNIFVYGTLKRGQHRAAALAEQEFLTQIRTLPQYWMFDLGTYPGLVDADANLGEAISGEVFRVDDPCRRTLDQIECVDSGLYELRVIHLEQTTGWDFSTEPVFAYFYLGSVHGCKRLQCWI